MEIGYYPRVKTGELIRVVLVRPEEAGNVGAAARVLRNFGLRHLVLVDPRLNRPEEAYTWAHGAEEVVEGLETTDTLAQAIASCKRAWAASRRRGKLRGPTDSPRQAAATIRQLAESSQPVAWVFGSESRGLSTVEVGLCSDRVYIPTSPEQPSLNLAQAIAVCAYETFLSRFDLTMPAPPPEASIEERNALYAHLRETLMEVGFLHSHTADTRMAVLRKILERARPTPDEVRFLRGVVRHVGWCDSGSGKTRN